jgi:hypothetical protein
MPRKHRCVTARYFDIGLERRNADLANYDTDVHPRYVGCRSDLVSRQRSVPTQLLSDSRLDNLAIQMPGRMSEYWHHDGEADETWRRADRQAAGDDEPSGGRSFHENSVPGIDAE